MACLLPHGGPVTAVLPHDVQLGGKWQRSGRDRSRDNGAEPSSADSTAAPGHPGVREWVAERCWVLGSAGGKGKVLPHTGTLSSRHEGPRVGLGCWELCQAGKPWSEAGASVVWRGQPMARVCPGSKGIPGAKIRSCLWSQQLREGCRSALPAAEAPCRYLEANLWDGCKQMPPKELGNPNSRTHRAWGAVMSLVMGMAAHRLSGAVNISWLPPSRAGLSFAGAAPIQPGFIHFYFLNWIKRTKSTKSRNAYKG